MTPDKWAQWDAVCTCKRGDVDGLFAVLIKNANNLNVNST